jgi:hypothetical protein
MKTTTTTTQNTIATSVAIEETFTMIDSNLLAASIQQITAQQKLLISWILRWQKNDKECFASNQKIAETFGMSKEGIKSLLKSCSYSFPTFFSCTPDTRDNGVPFHTITIDVEELMKFLIDEKPVNKIKRRNKPSTEKEYTEATSVASNKALESTITTQVITEDLEDEIVSKIEAIEVISTDRVKIEPVLKNKASKFFKLRKDDNHFDKQIKELNELLTDLNITYVDELTDEVKKFLKLEIVEDGIYSKVSLF